MNRYQLSVTWETGERHTWILQDVAGVGGADPIDNAHKRAVMVLDGLYGKAWPPMTEFKMELLRDKESAA